ncbi:MAG TPA: hypothetical protein VF139_05930, partial [Candidatus Polarisedimenticolaceae bacterium]
EDTPAPEAKARPVVQRRRVPAVVHLTDATTIEGDLYAAVGEASPGGEPILERLNDPAERYLPLARGDRHFLLHKRNIRRVELARVENPLEFGKSDAVRSFRVEIALDSGESVRGLLESHERAAHHRTLDHLNDSAAGFLRLVKGAAVVYVNHDHVVSVCDLGGPR